ncbi:hypothetical protein PH235_06985 [Trichococcus sp. K1Tr]|uniref:Uncharacterized protein n=1 Tax=Trichococcus shcherbakoviae subsp. psychrophilus TaxID=2585775 RepID=A0A5C5E7T6_9LACT|nr:MULTISPECIES: hypothetical protein [Trichococcus]MDB6353302.1 hypothetical protein [Trichococcus sp. K1Tr]OUL08889.1 hypothetical protein B0533_07215 [Sedimentibacter sp. SX930]TNV68692.1 hypothetical protein FHK04_10880 [Trichococcus shcherbakoviae subsp. psychrophilus]
MEILNETVKAESLKSFRSTIRKSENALTSMAAKGANTTLVAKRLKALRIGLAVLEQVWDGKPHPYTHEDLAEARILLAALLPSIEGIRAKSKLGSPQKTLLERRIKSLELALQEMDDSTDKDLS